MTDGQNKDGWWVLYSDGNCFKGPKVLVWSRPRITTGKGRNSHVLKKLCGIGVFGGEAYFRARVQWQLSEKRLRMGALC